MELKTKNIDQPMASHIAELLDLSGSQRMMDLGGGSGVISIALLRKYPALTSLVVDIKNVCIAGREIAVQEGLLDYGWTILQARRREVS